MIEVVLIVVAVVAVLAAVLVAVGVVSSRMLVRWSWPNLTPILRMTDDSVALPSNPLTRYEGVYGLRSPGGHARVGRILHDDGKTITRELQSTVGSIREATTAAYDGDLHASPAELGDHMDISIPTPLGVSPAWVFPSPNKAVWFIHVHGFQADRQNALRTVAALQQVPATHLVVSYRGDGEGTPTPHQTARLGLDEWPDVEAALAYADAHGAEQVIMVGWSMGAAISLLISENSKLAHLITGHIFVSPTTDWRATMLTSAKRMGIPLPGPLTAYTDAFLSSPIFCRLAGLRKPIDFDRLDWTKTRRVSKPTLVIHSVGDLTVPLDASRKFAQTAPDLIELHETKRAPHTREYNVDPEGFTKAIQAWSTRLLDRAGDRSL